MATPAAPGLPWQTARPTQRPTQRQARPRALPQARPLCWSSCRSTGPGCFNRSTAAAGQTCGSTWRPWSVSWVNCWSRPSGASARAEASPGEAQQRQASERDLVLTLGQIRHQGRRIPGGRLGGCCGSWGTACRWRRGRAASRSRSWGRAGLSTSRGRQRVRRYRGGNVQPCSASSRSRAKRMQTGQGELSALLLHPVLAGDRIHAQSTLQHESLPHLHTVLKILSQAAPAHHLQLARRIIGAQTIHLHGHLRHGGLVVLGVAQLGRLQHLHLQQAMVHRPGRRQGATS